MWDWVDQALTDPKDKQKKMCYGGDFGTESGVNDAQFCINGLIFANRKFHPAVSCLSQMIVLTTINLFITVNLTYQVYSFFMNSFSHFFTNFFTKFFYKNFLQNTGS